MLCEYFRHINLEQVYEQLEDFACHEAHSLSNIQTPFGDTLLSVFEDLAYVAFNGDEDEAWKKLRPIEIAAEVGDVIEGDLELMAAASEIVLPTARSSSRTAISKLTVLSIHASFGDFDYWQRTSLLAYQYDLLCWLYSKDRISEAFDVYELILKNYGQLSADYALSISSAAQSKQASNIARERAAKRHAPTNKVKSELLTEWDMSAREYKSRADFCRIVSQRERLLYRTVYEWIARHDRDRVNV